MANEEMYPVGKKVKVDPDNPKYAGVYVRADQSGKLIWLLYYRAHGKQIWETLGPGWTKKAAALEREKRLKEIKQGQYASPKESKMTFNQAWEIWRGWAKANISQAALANDACKYRNHIGPHLGHLQMKSITPAILEKWKEYLKIHSGLQEQTASGIMTLAIRIWNKVEEMGEYGGPNPWKRVKRIRKQVFRKRFLTMVEAAEILKTLKSLGWEREYRQASFGLLAGLRLPSEVMELTPIAIDLENNKIHIGLKSGKVKNGDSSRTVPLAPVLREIVLQMYQEKAYGPLDPLFESWNYHKWQKVLAPYNKGIPKSQTSLRVSPYTFRHTYASWLLDKGANLKAIQQILGHKSFKMTSDIYAKVAKDAASEAQTKLDEAIAQDNTFDNIW